MSGTVSNSRHILTMNKSIKYHNIITQVPARVKPIERKSTSLKINPDLYMMFAIEARLQHKEIQIALDEAMRLWIKESKRRK